MSIALITLIQVSIMLAYAVPGFLTVKTKMIKSESISAFATVLMYVCQPALTIYSMNIADYSSHLFQTFWIFFALAMLVQVLILGTFYFVFKKKGKEDAKYRVSTVATAFGNCGFLGVPILQAVMPNQPEAVFLSVAFLLGMNLIGWTLASAIITQNKKFVSLKKAILNPSMIGFLIGLPLFLTGTKLPLEIDSMITILAKMTTPLCMLIVGMRLATVSMKGLLCSPFQYFIVFVKQIFMPLFALAIVWFIPIDLYARQTMFILASTPVASIVLMFAEMLGEGQESAANLVLLGTVGCVGTIPLMMLILQAIS